MDRCCICRKEYDGRYEQEICDCGGGIVSVSDDMFDFMSEYDSDGF